jgi:4-cresol dehydrogenase (hydroxylating)
MANPTVTAQPDCAWPAQLGTWAERSPDTRALCRTERFIPWRLRPPSLGDVREVLRQAALHGTPLWPVSRGRNWGYGSHLPARSGTVVLDLGSLDAIGDLDRDSLSVRVEPGVTQAALYAFLKEKAPDLAFNVTGAGAGASVLGNALERGIGYGGERDRDVYALEVLLADGTFVGPVRGRNHRARAQPAGLSCDSLFFQSNLGIVTGARVRLRRRQEAEDAVILQGPFRPVMETLKRAYQNQLVCNPTHLAEPGRTQRLGFGLLQALWRRDPTAAEVNRCFPEQQTFIALFPLNGRRRVVNAAWRELRGLASPGVVLRRANSRTLGLAGRWLGLLGVRYMAARLMALRPILAMTWGEPSDAGLAALDGFSGGNPDLASSGAIYGNAVSALDTGEAERAAGIVRSRWADCAFTWILVDSRSMVTVYTLHFEDAAAKAAHAANAAIIEELRAAGLPPYRLDVSTPAPAGAEALLRRLKGALDPNSLIAPGRYES